MTPLDRIRVPVTIGDRYEIRVLRDYDASSYGLVNCTIYRKNGLGHALGYAENSCPAMVAPDVHAQVLRLIEAAEEIERIRMLVGRE